MLGSAGKRVKSCLMVPLCVACGMPYLIWPPEGGRYKSEREIG
jgi:hypothetical protein